MTAESRGRKVLFLGTHGQFNIGDELLLETFLTQLGSRHQYTLNSYAPEETTSLLEGRFHVDVFETAGDRRRLLRYVWRSDVVIFGGGSILKELNRATGRSRYSTLLMVLAIVVFARSIARRPILMSNIGVGPIPTRRGRWLARAILRRTSLVSVRDSKSESVCLSLGCDPQQLRLLPDAVFVNGPSVFGCQDVEGIGAASGFTTDPNRLLRIALNLNHDIENPDDWDNFLTRLATALRSVAEVTPIQLIGLPMQSRFKDDHDLAMLRSFLSSLADIPCVIEETIDHRDVAAIISRSDIVISERLHAIVIAAIVGRPAIALSYNTKVSELAAQLAVDQWSVDINRPFDPRALAGSILSVAAAREQEAARLSATAFEFRRSLEHYFSDIRVWLEHPQIDSWDQLVDMPQLAAVE